MKNLTSHHDQAKYKSFILMMHITYYFDKGYDYSYRP